LNDYDENSVQVVGNGSLTYSYIGIVQCLCPDQMGTECCWQYNAYCDGQYIGASQAPCGPTPRGVETPSESELRTIINGIKSAHPEYGSLNLNEKFGAATVEGRNTKVSPIQEKTTLGIIEIYPNPFDNLIAVRIHSDREQEVKISLLDMNGQKLSEHHFLVTEGSNLLEFAIDGHYPWGAYLLKTTDENGNTNGKLVIKAN
jgi:hypothetical protein